MPIRAQSFDSTHARLLLLHLRVLRLSYLGHHDKLRFDVVHILVLR
jgi:hypothetical protein